MVAIIDGKIGKPNPEDLFTIPDLTTRYGDQFFFGVDPDTGTSVLYLQKDPTKPINQGAGANDKPIQIGFLNPAAFKGDVRLVGSTSGVIGPSGLQPSFIYNNNEESTGLTPFIGGLLQRELRKISLNIINNPNIIGGNNDGSDPNIKAGDVFKSRKQSNAFNASFDRTANPAPKDPNSLNPFSWGFLANEAILAAQRTGEASNADPLVGCRGSAELLTQVGVNQGFFTPEFQRILNVTITGEPTGRPSSEVGFELDSELSLLEPGLSTRENVRSNTGSSVSSGILKYPIYDVSEFGYDYIKITRYTYARQRKATTKSRLGSKLETICLPMQPNLSETHSVDWGAGRLNQIQRKAADLAVGAITNTGNSNNIQDLISTASSLFQGAVAVSKDFAKDPNVPMAIKAYLVGQALGVNLQARKGAGILNPNLELLFNGGKLRTFQFNFNLTPRNMVEACIVRDIIKVFKTALNPKRSPSKLFLGTPDIFKLEYIYQGIKHPFMNEFKPCALLNFTVNYTPANSYMTYEGGSMTMYSINMTFSELEPIYQKDQEISGGTGF